MNSGSSRLQRGNEQPPHQSSLAKTISWVTSFLLASGHSCLLAKLLACLLPLSLGRLSSSTQPIGCCPPLNAQVDADRNWQSLPESFFYLLTAYSSKCFPNNLHHSCIDAGIHELVEGFCKHYGRRRLVRRAPIHHSIHSIHSTPL